MTAITDPTRRWYRPRVADNVASLEPFARAGVVDSTDVHLASAIARLGGLEGNPDDIAFVLAVASASAGLRRSHVCLDLGHASRQLLDTERDLTGRQSEPPELPWPDPATWRATLERHRLVSVVTDEHSARSAAVDTTRPLVIHGNLLYLQRVWRDETLVRDKLVARATASDDGAVGEPAHGDPFEELFSHTSAPTPSQRAACVVARSSRISVIAGGPGTGKTWTIARVLAAAVDADPTLGMHRIALCAPTGKAAARMTESLRAAAAEMPFDAVDLGRVSASTVHSLLGIRPGRPPRHDAGSPLPHKIVVVDETSMLALADMARLLDALRSDARLVLVGDPDQLASVDAGTVLGDIVDSARTDGDPTPLSPSSGDPSSPLKGRIVELTRGHRFNADVGALADAIRHGHTDAAIALLTTGSSPSLRLVDPAAVADLATVTDSVAGAAAKIIEYARAGDVQPVLAAALEVKVLTATRQGPMGFEDWTRRIEQRLARQDARHDPHEKWYAGRPVLSTVNDYVNGIRNGDAGVTVASPNGLQVAFAQSGSPRVLATSQLRSVETWWAMTIHKSQGSEFDHVIVTLPTRPSPILTRELLYTAVTRARSSVTIVADLDRVREAIERPIQRTSGLRERLRGTI